MLRRRITTYVSDQQKYNLNLIKYRHSHLNQNQSLKNQISAIFQSNNQIPIDTKQKLHYFSKTLNSFKNQYLGQELKNSNIISTNKLKIIKKNQKGNQYRQPIKSDQAYKITNNSTYFPFKCHNYQNKSQISKNDVLQLQQIKNQQKYGKTESMNWFISKKYISQHIEKKGKNCLKLKNGNLPLKIQRIQNPNKQNKYNRISTNHYSSTKNIYKNQIRKNRSQTKKEKRKSEFQQKYKPKLGQNKQNRGQGAKRLWQYRAIRLKRKQNSVIYKLILNQEVQPNKKSLQYIDNKNSNLINQTIKRYLPCLKQVKQQKSNLSHYQQNLKQLEMLQPKYGLKQKSMSTSKLDHLKNKERNFFKLY